jgi:hypothetical protein
VKSREGGVAHKKKTVFTVADMGVKKTKRDLRNVLNLVEDERRIVGLTLQLTKRETE